MLVYWVPTSRICGCVRGCTYFVSYSWRTSRWINAESLVCWEKEDCNISNCVESRAARMMVVKMVVLGRGSCTAVGKKSQYIRTWPGLNRQNSLRHNGVGSHIASSQTSLVASGCDLASAVADASILERKRRGDDDSGEESTRTRCAEGVLGGLSMEASKSR